MSVRYNDEGKIVQAADAEAWKEFNLLPDLTPDERLTLPAKIRGYIKILTAAGELDPHKIAQCALAIVREKEKIARSKAGISSSF
jgi:hypothetical protein